MDIWNKVELKIQELARGVSSNEMYILILCEVGSQRKLPLLLSRDEAQYIMALMMSSGEFRPILNNTLHKITSAYGIIIDEVLLIETKDGSCKARVSMYQCGQLEQIVVDSAEAVILSLTYRCPIFASPKLLESTTVQNNGGTMIAIPMKTLSVELLREALNRAIKEENYELASQLRDEINRRT